MHMRGKLFLFYLVLGALITPPITLTAQVSKRPGNARLSGKIRREGNGVPFLLSASGHKGNYINLASNRIDIEVHGEKMLGTVTLQRLAEREVEVRFASPLGNELGFRTVGSSTGAVRTEFRFNSQIVQLEHLTRLSSEKELEIEQLFSNASSDPTLRELAREALPFLSSSSLRLVLPVTSPLVGENDQQQHVTDCAVEAADCLVSLLAYGVSMSALYSSCGFTLGAGCVAALISHPLLGGAVAIYCGRALSSCGLTR
jgi:hypothetical protein